MDLDSILDASPEEPETTAGGDTQPAEQVGEYQTEAASAEQPKKVESPTVPLEALREERERRRELQAQLQTMETRMEQILAAMQQRNAPMPEEEPQVSYDEDPIGYLRSQIENLNKQLSGMTQQQSADHMAARFREVQQNVATAEQSFASQHPDYWDAVNYLRQRRVAELEALGYDERQIAAVVGQDAANIVNMSMQRGQDPASFAYNMAKKLGFQGSAQVKDQAPTSLSGMGGGVTPDKLTAQDVSKMSDAEFQALFKKYFPG